MSGSSLALSCWSLLVVVDCGSDGVVTVVVVVVVVVGSDGSDGVVVLLLSLLVFV